MATELYTIIATLICAVIISAFCFPLLIKLSVKVNYTDKPGKRKLHKQPIPVIGGIGMVITILLTAIFIPQLRVFIQQHWEIASALAIIAITGIIDDKYLLSAKAKLLIEIICAIWIANTGIKIDSFHGFLSLGVLPVALQYIVTILIVVGITNAFNLLDGIDGLAGTIALINILLLAIMSVLKFYYNWAIVLAAISGCLMIFLKYNKMPARIFMGDGGSLFLGFLMSVTAIHLLNSSGTVNSIIHENVLVVLLTACFIIPVVDTLRVFVHRMMEGRSPFSADKNHLHHKLIQHFIPHGMATRKLAQLHILIIIGSLILSQWIGISLIIIFQFLLVAFYTSILDFTHSFSKWYRFVKRLEKENN